MRIYLLVQKDVILSFLWIMKSSFPMQQSTVQMESSRSSTLRITTTSFNVNETFVQISFIKGLKITTDLLVQKAVIGHFFWQILHSPFPIIQSNFQMQSSRCSTQKITTTSSNVVETFLKQPFIEAPKIRIYLQVKTMLFTVFCGLLKVHFQCYCRQFKFESSLSSTRKLKTTSSNVIETFVKTSFIEASKMRIYLLVQKDVIHSFYGLWKVHFHCYSLQFKWNKVVLLLK